MLHHLRYLLSHPLGGRRPARAIARWVRWQVGSRLALGPVVVPWVAGTRLLAAPGLTGATGNVYCGLHELEDMAFVLHALRPDELFVDVGANVGSYTVLAGGAVGARVVAFEPVPEARGWLEQNVGINRLGERVEVRAVAVGDAEGEVRMTCDADTMNRVVGGEHPGPTVAVPLGRLDALLADHEPSRPAVVKVDVEGHERAVFEGARATLGQSELVGLVLEHGAGPEEERRLRADLATLGLSPVHYDPFARRLWPRTDLDRGGNVIYVRDLARAQARVTAARRFAVLDTTI